MHKVVALHALLTLAVSVVMAPSDCLSQRVDPAAIRGISPTRFAVESWLTSRAKVFEGKAALLFCNKSLAHLVTDGASAQDFLPSQIPEIHIDAGCTAPPVSLLKPGTINEVLIVKEILVANDSMIIRATGYRRGGSHRETVRMGKGTDGGLEIIVSNFISN